MSFGAVWTLLTAYPTPSAPAREPHVADRRGAQLRLEPLEVGELEGAGPPPLAAPLELVAPADIGKPATEPPPARGNSGRTAGMLSYGVMRARDSKVISSTTHARETVREEYPPDPVFRVFCHHGYTSGGRLRSGRGLA